MTDKSEVRDGPMTVPEMTYEFVRTRFLSIVAVLALIAAAIALIGFDLGLSRQAKLAGLTGIAISPFAYVVGDWVRRLLPDPPGIVLVDVDARFADGAVFWLHVDDFQALEVTEGQLHQAADGLYFGKDVDLDTLTVKGTWRGSMSDRELLSAFHKVEEVRGTLEDDAKRGFAIETQAFQIVRGAVRDATEHIVETFEAGTLPDEGDSIGHRIDAALDRYDLDAEVEQRLDDDDDLLDDDQDDGGDDDGGPGADSDRTNGRELQVTNNE